ncbi:MAG: L,D-transpeptidase family protein [Anaerolineales bacterium]
MAAKVNWRALCKEAKSALARGERNQARRLAHQAAKAAPGREEPWLLLAAMAAPGASRAYLKRALQVNPRSRRATHGLRWAEQRLKEGNKRPERGDAVLATPRLANLALFGLLALTASLAAFAWFRPPAIDEGLRAMGVAVAHQLDGLVASETAEPTVAFTATFTPFATMTSLPSATPTPTSTPLATATPSATPTAAVDLQMGRIEKYYVELPDDLEGSERWIEVDLGNQTLTAFEGTDLVKSFSISSGRPNTPTVTGEFRIWVKVRNQTMSGPGYSLPNVPWVMYFYKDYGIHGTWWHNNFGTPMSAGCVNMTIDDALWMYGWASVGTIVKVHN